MSGQGDGVPKLHPRVREAVRKAGNKGGPSSSAPSAGGHKLAWLPYLMLVFVVVTSLRVAIEAFDAGNAEAAIGPLLAILFAAFRLAALEAQALAPQAGAGRQVDRECAEPVAAW